jgi:cytidine deaminase
MLMTTDDLIAEAKRAAENAYVPYSGFRVGSVVIDDAGNRYSGANVENSAYGATVCAEATAIANAVASGARKLTTVVVACIDAGEPGYPCGNCRQMMREFDVESVIVDGPDGPIEHTLEELLPHGFRL